MLRSRLSLAALLASCLLLAVACSAAPPAADLPADIETTYEVSYRDGTVLVETGHATAQLVSAAEDGRTFHFRPSDELRVVQPGQVAILGGVGFGRVAAVRESGGELIIELDEASLDEAISDGEISWRYPLRWDQLPEESYAAGADTLASAFVEQAGLPLAAARVDVLPRLMAGETGLKEGLTYSGKVQDWDVTVSLTPTAERLNIELTASHALPLGTKASASVTGWVSSFTQETFLRYENSSATQLSTRAIGLESELELKWSAAKLGEALTKVTSFKVPVSLPIPFTVGPIPVVIKVGANLQVVPELSVDQASSGGSYKVHYRSDQGFEINGGSQSVLGELLNSDIGVSGETVSAGWGVVAFALGVEFPRLEISVFGTTSAFITLKTYSTSQFTPGTTLTSDIPPCQMGTTSIAAFAGYSLKLLGFKLGEKTEQLWKTEYEKFKDDKPCTLTGG